MFFSFFSLYFVIFCVFWHTMSCTSPGRVYQGLAAGMPYTGWRVCLATLPICMHWQVSHDHKKKSGLKIDNHIWKRNVTSKKWTRRKKSRSKSEKRRFQNWRKKIGQKNHNQIKKIKKRSENLMKKMCYRKKREKTRNNISQICFRVGEKRNIII